MPGIIPVHYKEFDKFLKYVGCVFERQAGDHRIYKKAGLKRPLVVPAVKEIPVFIILNNLRILGISRTKYLNIIEKL